VLPGGGAESACAVQYATAVEEERSAVGTAETASGQKAAREVHCSDVVDSVPAVVCRARHPTGWVIECASWPDPSWMKELTGEGT
jgi:hypothetical protein